MPETVRDRLKRVFTQTELAQLRDFRRRIADVLPVCDDAEACGASVQGPRQALQAMDLQFIEIEKRFMPSPASDPHDE